MDSANLRKTRGAFFTPPEIASYLVDWAVRSPKDKVLEPSCGEASFLLAAGNRLKEVGLASSSLREQLHGIEIFEASARNAEVSLRAAGFDAQISIGDFFELEPVAAYDAVVGNPPFVRYQNFSGEARTRSLEAALAQGVRLSGLANAWAAFVVEAARHLKPDGRLALVLPAELLSVHYAQEVRRYLLRRFSSVRLIMFEMRVFPGVLEEVILLLAEGSGGADHFEVHQTRDVHSLDLVEAAKWATHTPDDNEKWTPALIAEDVFATYKSLVDDRFEQLSAWGSAYLGAVTGNNKFFSISVSEANAHGLLENDVVRISPPGARHLHGLTFTKPAWAHLAKEDSRCLLFCPAGDPSDAAQEYITKGERMGVSAAYKCRTRKPWWRVPLVRIPDLFLTYMNHDRPRLISNSAGVQVLNSVYGIQLCTKRRRLGRDFLPIACLNSVTLLGSEIVGRAYGGGLLKMEPREADRLPVPSLHRINMASASLRAIRPRLARALRSGNLTDAVEVVDQIVLDDIRDVDVQALRLARETLFQRRRARSRRGKN